MFLNYTLTQINIMIKNILRVAYFLILIVVVGCQKDSEKFVPTDNSKDYVSNIFGIVVDADQNPVEGATVQFNGKTVVSDQYGTYSINNVKVNSKHDVVNIIKDGFFESIKTIRTNHSKTIRVKSQLIAKSFDQSFNTNSGGQTKSGLVSINFPAESIMHENGDSYTGEVKVAMGYINPITSDGFEQMPGDLTGIGTDEVVNILSSYGMVAVELESPSGDKLQIAKGKSVEMTAEIPSEITSSAPNNIPMWYFDEKGGVWKEEGIAEKVGNTYVAQVEHFTYWNYDYSEPSIILSGRVIDENGNPVSNVHVWVSVVGEYLGGHGNTDSDGTFSGPVAKDKNLELKILSNAPGCWNEVIYTQNIGPYSVDTDMGDIILDSSLSELDQVTIKADVIDCDLNPVTNGFAKLGYNFFEITDGSVDITYITCGTTPLNFKVVDRDQAKESNSQSLTVPGDHDLGTISACDSDVDFVHIICPELGIDYRIIDSVQIVDFQDAKFLSAHGYENTKNESYGLTVYYEELMAGFNQGTFPTNLETNFFYNAPMNVSEYYFIDQGNPGEVTITQGGTSGDKIQGSFILPFVTQGSSNTCNMTGTFSITAN